MKASDPVTVVTYRKLRGATGKSAIVKWQEICLMFGFDPDPNVTVAIYASAEIEDPTKVKPEEIGGPIGPTQGIKSGAKTIGLDPEDVKAIAEQVEEDFGSALGKKSTKLGIDLNNNGKVDQSLYGLGVSARPTVLPPPKLPIEFTEEVEIPKTDRVVEVSQPTRPATKLPEIE